MAEKDRQYLFLRSIFGVNRNVHGNLCFVPAPKGFGDDSRDQVICRVCGNTICFSNDESGRQFFLRVGEECQRVTCVSVSDDGNYFVVCCRCRVKDETDGPPPPFIVIYDVSNYKEVKRISIPSVVGCRDVIRAHLCTSRKLLFFQCSEPYRLGTVFFHAKDNAFTFNIRKTVVIEKVIKVGEQEFRESSFNGENVICVSGVNLLKLYHIDDGRLTCIRSDAVSDFPQSEQGKQDFCSHCFISPKRLIVCNSLGSLYLLTQHQTNQAQFQYQCLLTCSPSNEVPITCAIPYQKAFALGQEDGQILLYERSDFDGIHEGMFKKQRTIKIPNPNDELPPEDLIPMDIHLDKGSGTLLVITKASHTLNIAIAGVSLKSMAVPPLKFTPALHTRTITDIDMATRQPLLATASRDRTVQIMDYRTGEIIVREVFQMEAHSLSLHPTGYYIAVGFTDKLRLFKVLQNSLREEAAFPLRSCQEVRFSHGGQYFGAAHGTSLHVYGAYTYEHLYALRSAHSARVSSLFWSNDDTHVTSVDVGGSVVHFQLKNETKVWEQNVPGVRLSSVICTDKATIVAGNDGRIHVFVEQVSLSESRCPVALQSLCLCVEPHRWVIGGRTDGGVCVYSPHELDHPKEIVFECSDCVSRICCGVGGIIGCVSEDGSVCLYEMRGSGERKERMIGGLSCFVESMDIGAEFDDELLIDRSDLRVKEGLIYRYGVKCADVRSESEYHQIKRRLEYEHRMKKQREDYLRRLNTVEGQISELEKNIEERRRTFSVERKERAEYHRKESSALESRCSERVSSLLKKGSEVEGMKGAELKRLASEAVEAEFIREEEKKRVQEEYENECLQLKEEVKNLTKELNKIKVNHNELLKVMRTKESEELDEREAGYVRALQNAEAREIELRKKNSRKEEKEGRDVRKEQRLSRAIRDQQNALRERRERLVGKQREGASMMSENKEREETIREKERRIRQLRQQNRELKKFRFVLKYKIGSLEEEMNPSKESIIRLKDELRRYDEELSDYLKVKRELDGEVKGLEGRMKGNDLEITKLIEKVGNGEGFRRKVMSDLNQMKEMMDMIDEKKLDIKEWIRWMVSFYHEMNDTSSKGTMKNTSNLVIQKELHRERTHLEKTVESLKKKLSKAERSSSKETKRVMHENVMLINELNNLKKEVVYLNRSYHLKKTKRNKGGSSMFPNIYEKKSDMGNNQDWGLKTQVLKDKREIQILQIEALKKQKNELLKDNANSRSNSRGSSRGTSRGNSRGNSRGTSRGNPTKKATTTF